MGWSSSNCYSKGFQCSSSVASVLVLHWKSLWMKNANETVMTAQGLGTCSWVMAGQRGRTVVQWPALFVLGAYGIVYTLLLALGCQPTLPLNIWGICVQRSQLLRVTHKIYS